jgi:hypothetical protein
MKKFFILSMILEIMTILAVRLGGEFGNPKSLPFKFVDAYIETMQV